MRFSSPSGDFVELVLDGYEFASSPSQEKYDSDAEWLYVRGRARRSSESWKFRHPCLSTGEARELLAWLRRIPGSSRQSIEFMEPLLSFCTDPRSGNDSTIVITLSGEAAPPSLSEHARWGEGCPMTFRVSRGSLIAAADEWEREVTAFPVR